MADAPIPSPAELLQWLNWSAIQLEKLGTALEQAYIALGDSETEYEEQLDDALINLVDECERQGERIPPQDLRSARARKAIGFSVYTRYRKAKHLVNGLEKRSRLLESAVGARQSTLRGLREGSGRE